MHPGGGSYFFISVTVMYVTCQCLFLSLFSTNRLFCQNSDLSLLSFSLHYTNSGNAFQLVFKVRLSTTPQTALFRAQRKQTRQHVQLHIKTPLKPTEKKSLLYIFIYQKAIHKHVNFTDFFFKFLILPLLYIIRNTRLKTNLYKDKTVQQSIGSQSVFHGRGLRSPVRFPPSG